MKNELPEVKDYRILTKQDLRGLLGISSQKINLLIKRGLPYIDLGDRQRLFLRESVIEWLKLEELPRYPDKRLAQPTR